MIKPSEGGERYELNSATSMPNASGYLWNKSMMVHLNCRGYAVGQFMQPEPAKYARAPNYEATTFVQPEPPYYAHHPGRFCYIKDEKTKDLFSAPHEPVRAKVDSFKFSQGKEDVSWQVKNKGIQVDMEVSLPEMDPLELWTFKVSNTSSEPKEISFYPYFPVGYMSWVNQSGLYRPELNAIVCSCVSPYQKYQDYPKIKNYKDKTFLLADTVATSWEVNQWEFEGEGGLNNPSGISQEELNNGDSLYETPACVMQYRLKIAPGDSCVFRFVFGPANSLDEIESIKGKYFGISSEKSFAKAKEVYKQYISKANGSGAIQIDTPDEGLNNFVNHWLPRQMYYHGETNRLTTDPQTRNYLQDNMGMGYIIPEVAKKAYMTAISQQSESGAMPDGILLHKDAKLKYINEVPHADHCAWLPISIKAYLDETNDYDFLQLQLPFAGTEKTATVAEHLDLAMAWLLKHRDKRGLSYIEQGDWCDPMNMVGPKGVGVSGWLSMAMAYALNIWAEISHNNGEIKKAIAFRTSADEVIAAINKHLWDGKWYARGITDDNVIFGVQKDKEGRIFLNAQSWSILSGCADEAKTKSMIAEVEEQLETPFGVELFGPAFTSMREDVGRVTQKHPGSAENGSIYNHASAFYIFSLYKLGETEKAFELVRKMIPSSEEEDILQRGQLPVYIPNYYRGAYRQFPRTAGRSSQLFNTGTVPWFYRCLIDGLFGLQGDIEGLRIQPQLPKAWDNINVVRSFRGAEFKIDMKRVKGLKRVSVEVDGKVLEEPLIKNIRKKTYIVKVSLPA